MDISFINSQSLLRLLSLAERKEEVLQILEQIDAEIIRTLKGGVSVEVVEIAPTAAIAAPAPTGNKPVTAKRKTGISPEGRAKIAAASKARWAKVRAAKADSAASKPAKPAKAPKAARKPATTKRKSGLSPEGRAKLAANMKARWAARRAVQTAA